MEIYRYLTTTRAWKQVRGTQLIAVPNGKKVRSKTICSQVPKSVNSKDMGKVQRLDGCELEGIDYS